jgi:PLP dependent protein
MDISANIKKLSVELPPGVKIVAVSKTRTPEEVMKLYSAGHKIIGENKVQELVVKKEALPVDIKWHMVGHLQSNKVKYIAPFVSLIHSVDSLKLIKILNKEAIKNDRIIDILLQVHIALEERKFGFSEKEVYDLLSSFVFDDYPGVRVRGLMGMATFTENEDNIRTEFRRLAGIFRNIRDNIMGGYDFFNELSMGMSGDYRIAVEEGSTIIRIGSLIFGEREN